MQVRELCGDHLARRPRQHLQPQVDRTHDLDRIVVDVGGDAATLLLLRALQPLGQLAPLLDGPSKDLEAPAKLLLGFLLRRDVQHQTAPVQRAALVVEHQHGLVADPHDAAVLRLHPVLRDERSARHVRSFVLCHDALAVLRVDLRDPQIGRRPPLLLAVAQEADGLRAGVVVRGELVGAVDVEDRGDGLDERAVEVGVVGDAGTDGRPRRSQPADEPGQERHARDHAREIDPFRGRVVVAAHRAQVRRASASRRRSWCWRRRRRRWRRPAARSQARPRYRSRAPPGARPPDLFSIGRCQPLRLRRLP